MTAILNVYKTSAYTELYSKAGGMTDPVFPRNTYTWDGALGQSRDIQLYLRNDGNFPAVDIEIDVYDISALESTAWSKVAATRGGLDGAAVGNTLSAGNLAVSATYTFWIRVTVPSGQDVDDIVKFRVRSVASVSSSSSSSSSESSLSSCSSSFSSSSSSESSSSSSNSSSSSCSSSESSSFSSESSSSSSESSSSSSSGLPEPEDSVLWIPEMTIWTPEHKPKYSRFLTVNRDAPLGLGEDVIGLWLLNEGGGNLARDSSGFDNDGTITDATWGIGLDELALAFTGDYITVADNQSMKDLSGLTLLTRYNNTDNGASQRLFSKQDSFAVQIRHDLANSPLYLFVYDEGAILRGGLVVGFDWSVYSGQWINLAFVFDGTNATVYVDGASAGSVGCAFATIKNTANVLYIGNDNAGNPITGSMENAAIYRRAISTAQVAQLSIEPYSIVTEQFPKSYFLF